jgi:hypothetical protein
MAPSKPEFPNDHSSFAPSRSGNQLRGTSSIHNHQPQGGACEHLILYAFGGVGALLYAYPMFLAARKFGDAYALPVFGLALVIGTVIADPLVAVIGAHFPWMVRPDGRPLAFAIGLLVNPVAQPLVVEYLANLFRALIGVTK